MEADVFFTVEGVPAPQGSKTPYGTESSKRLKPWREAVGWEARTAMGGRPAWEGPVAVTVHFYFPRPKSHWRSGGKGGILKNDAPTYHPYKPDIDKLLRAINDAMTGIVYEDDSQVANVNMSKSYGDPARAIVSVRALY